MEADEIFEQLSTRIAPERRGDALGAYTGAAKNGTTAFLTCYFLGLVGAHRLYLGDWRGAALRLLIPIGLTVVAVAGILDLAPPLIALALAAAVLVIGLVWEGIDLTRIDREVQQHNRELAEALIIANGGSGVRLPATAARVGGATPSASSDSRWQSSPALAAQPAPDVMTQSPARRAASTGGQQEPEPSYQPAPQPVYQPSPAFSYNQIPRRADAPFLDPLYRSGPQPIPQPPHGITQPLPAVSSGAQAANSTDQMVSVEPGLRRIPQSTNPLPAQSAAPAQRAPDRVAPDDRATPTTGPASSSPFAAASSLQPGPSSSDATPDEVSEAGREGTLSRPMKRIRVKRRIVVDGEVVGEQVVEELVPLDVDTQVAAAALRARLAQMTPEQVAALAKLPPGDSIVLRDGTPASR